MTGLGEFLSLKNSLPTDADVIPIWVNDAHRDNAKFKTWFTSHLPIAEYFNQLRIWNEWNNLLWYTGEILEYIEGSRQVENFTGFKKGQRRTVPFWVNHIGDLVDKRSNDLSSLKPNFEITPPGSNITEQTRTAARVAKPIASHIRNFNNLDLLFDENERSNTTYGMSFLEIEWNKKVGDRILSKKKNKKIAEQEDAEDPKWEGEVVIKQLFPWYLLPLPARVAFESPMCIQIYEIINVHEARKKYNRKNIQPDGRTELFSFSSPFGQDILPGEVVIYRVICKPNEYLPNGSIHYCTHDGTVLKKQIKKYPYSHNDFPWEMHSDIKAHGKIFPYSVMNNLKPMQWTYNLLGGMIKKNIFLTSHPKWMMTRGACNIQSLGNGTTVVQHKAGQMPSLARYDVVGSDVTQFRENVKGEMQKLAGSFGLSNGDIPPNTRSGIQISRLQNIEKMNRSYQMGKRNDFMRRVLLKALSVAADYYPTTSSEHLVRILGQELADNVHVLADNKVSEQYVLNIQNGSGFSDDLAGRLDEVAFAREKLPGLMTPQQEADIIGVRSSEKFYDIATAALRMAESENEQFNDGKDVLPPLIEQDHIQHWQNHVIDMQTPQHAMLPLKIQLRKQNHLGMHEMFMEQLAMQPAGILFKQRLATLERWPLIYKPNMDIAAIEAERAQQQGQPQMSENIDASAPSGAPAPMPSENQPIQ